MDETKYYPNNITSKELTHFLGNYKYNKHGYDLYLHIYDAKPLNFNFIAISGEREDEYHSGATIMSLNPKNNDPVLFETFRRAIEQKLLIIDRYGLEYTRDGE